MDADRRGQTPIDEVLAEGVGFEPTIRLPVYTLSKRAPSATRPSLLRAAEVANIGPGGVSASHAAGPARRFEGSRPIGFLPCRYAGEHPTAPGASLWHHPASTRVMPPALPE